MSFKPFPPGTVRGPFTCGLGTKHDGGVQFAVKCRGGCWAYSIGPKGTEAAVRAAAEERAQRER